MSKRRIPRFSAAPVVLNIIGSNLETMDHFKMFLISAIEQEKNSIEARFEEVTKGMPLERIEHYTDLYSEDYYMVEDVFSRISLHWFIIVLYSYIETGMNRFCDAVRQDRARDQKHQREKQLTLRYTDLQGKGIKRAKLYLEKVIGLDLGVGEKGKNKKQWNELLALNKIRNAIVHDDGWATDEILKDVTIKHHLKKGRLEIESRGTGSHGKITVKPEYLDWIIAQAGKFFGNLAV